MRFLRAMSTAVLCSAALPTTATTITPTKMEVIPKASAAPFTEPTSISLTHAINAVAPSRTSTEVRRLQTPSGAASGVLSPPNRSLWVCREKNKWVA